MIWSWVAIQKWDNKYKVSIDEIEEQKIYAEEYMREEVTSYDNLREAFDYIENSSRVDIDELTPLKGSKFFDPSL